MSCDVHFDTTIRNGIVGVCGCGFYGEPIDKWNGMTTEYECPKCGTVAQQNLVLDIGNANKVVVKTWPGSKTTYNKSIKINVIELRRTTDPRNMSEYIAGKSASSILWEVIRTLEPNLPKKPKMKDFDDKSKFFDALKGHKARWAKMFKMEYTIASLLKGKERSISEKNNPKAENDAKGETKAILKALGINLNTAKMSSKFAFIGMASKLCDKRKEIELGLVKAAMARTTVNAMLDCDRLANHPDLEKWLFGIASMFENISIRSSVIKSMKTKYGFIPGFTVVKMGTYKPFEKSTWREKEFMDANPEFFANPAFSMERGKPIIENNGSSWVYDPVFDGMMQIEGPSCTTVPYSEEIGEDISEEDIEEPIREDEDVIIDESDDTEYLAVA